MSTACFDLGREIPRRLDELRVLTMHARHTQDKDKPLYNVLCRSCCVLLAAHVEGFLKDLTTSIVNDLNYHLPSFDGMPAALQNTFCHKIAYFDGVPKEEVNARTNQLKAFFSTNSVPIDLRAFDYKENPNRNPNGNYIDGSLEKIGVPCALQTISTPYFEVVFDNSERTNYRLYREMKSAVSGLYSFPYRGLMPGLIAPKPPKSSKKETFWHTFIEDIMVRRHNIVHGDIKSNEASWDDLSQDVEKLGILMYGLLFASTGYLAAGLRSA